jgi:signal transduction histidine kinase
MLFTIVLQNLIDNGLKYNRSPIPTVSLGYYVKNKRCYLLVTDNGIGIKEEYFNQIFEPFKRVDASNHFKGTGLGLSGARRAAERIGGSLLCLRSSDQGSVFQFSLPYSTDLV